MGKIFFSNDIELQPDAIVYMELPPKTDDQVFNGEVWNYLQKGPNKPVLISIRAEDVSIGEKIFNLDGEYIGERMN